MFNYRLEHICTYTAMLNPELEVIGPVAEGLRINYYVTGGEVSGPKIRGKLRPVGADWITIRTDGVGTLNVRITMETQDGALIYVTYEGIVDYGEDGYQKALQQALPRVAEVRICPRFQTSHPNYLWLNRLVCIGISQYTQGNDYITYDVYAIR